MALVALGKLRVNETNRVLALYFRAVTALQFLVEGTIAPDEPRFEEIGANRPVGFRLPDAILHRTGRVADFEAEVPQEIEDGLDRLLARRGDLVGQEEEQIDIGEGGELAPPVAAGRDQRQPFGGTRVRKPYHSAEREIVENANELID